jgi:hypothetical protein
MQPYPGFVFVQMAALHLFERRGKTTDVYQTWIKHSGQEKQQFCTIPQNGSQKPAELNEVKMKQ